MNRSDQLDALGAALSKAQAAIKVAAKDANNPFFKSQYADLPAVWAACQKALTDNGLSFTQVPDFDDANAWLETMILHSSGQWISGRYPVRPVKNDPQGMGSAMTYARRYALAAMVGVVAGDEDDDGNAASGHTKPTQREAIHGPSTLKTPVASDAYAPPDVKPLVTTDKAANAKAWALREIPRIKTLGKDDLDKFSERFKNAREELKVLDPKTSVELEKALNDRLEALFA